MDRKQERAFEGFVAEFGGFPCYAWQLSSLPTRAWAKTSTRKRCTASPLDGLGCRTRGRSAAR